MSKPGKIYIRCMGGSRCNHVSGECTASPEYQAMIERKEQMRPAVEVMSLRDWFAGQALAGQLAAVDQQDAATMKERGEEWTYRMFAKHSYALADALLAQRNPTGDV